MGEVIELPAGKARKSLVKRIKTEERAERRRTVAKSLMQRLHAIGAGSRRLAIKSVRSLLAHFVNAMASILSAFRRPIRSVCTLGIVAMVASLVIQGMNHWKEPLIVVWSIIGLCFFLGGAALYDSIIEALYKLRDTIKE